MKNILLFITLLFFRQWSSAQITDHFPHEDAVWGQFEGVYFDDPFGSDYYSGGSQFYAAAGDSLLNGYTYIKVYNADVAGNVFNFPPRLIREDMDKVYYYDPNLEEDTLLYDFSLQPGDTAHVYSDHQIYTVVADSVGEMLVGNQMRKCIYFNQQCGQAVFNQQNFFTGDNTPVTWIEGIGSNDGLFTPAGGAYVVDGIAFLTCFRENDTVKYGTECNLVYNGEKDPVSHHLFQIFPNPTSGIVVIGKNNLNQETEMVLYSAAGEKVWSKHFPKASSDYEQLDLSSFPDGLYLLQTTSGKVNITEKIQLLKN